MKGDRIVIVTPSVAPLGVSGVVQREEGRLSNFDSSVYAVSFGFVATVLLILMFLVMALFERFLQRRSARGRDLEGQMMVHGKLDYPSLKMSIYAKGVSVLMPGEEIPTFIAHQAPVPCPPP